MKRLILKISGQVQGVFFRENVRRKAVELGLSGTVENCSDDTVEIIAEGEVSLLNELLEWAKHGPELAKVDKVIDVWEEPTGKFSDFQVK